MDDQRITTRQRRSKRTSRAMLKTTRTWKERIVAAATGRNKRGVPLWYSHDQICRLIADQENGIDPRDVCACLTPYLFQLVKSGHFERAVMPPEIREAGIRSISPIPVYLYRRTEKPYTRGQPKLLSSKNMHTEAARLSVQGYELWRLYPYLPTWFRRMMMD